MTVKGRVLLVMEYDIANGDPQDQLDDFREAVLPSDYDLTLTRATPDDVREFVLPPYDNCKLYVDSDGPFTAPRYG